MACARASALTRTSLSAPKRREISARARASVRSLTRLQECRNPAAQSESVRRARTHMAQAVRQEVKVQIHSLDVRSRRVEEQRMSISPRSGDGQILHGSASTTEAVLSCNFSLTERKGDSHVSPCYSTGSGDRPPSVECSRVRL